MNEYDTQLFTLTSVNIILESIGELPLEDESDIDAILEARIAKQALIEAKLEVLSMGWDINTDTDYTFLPDTDGITTKKLRVLNLKKLYNVMLSGT
jgi:hypothetical protein